jgi:prolipoprotein diacylglyceryltransferase
LIAYGLFRFGHEFVRDTPRYPGTAFSPYMGLALGCVALGAWGFWRRKKTVAPDHFDTAAPIKNTN